MTKKIISKFFAGIVFTLFTTLSFATEKDFSISVSTSLVNGFINEHVFDLTTTQSDKLMSRLDWDIVNIPVIGVDFEKYFNKLYIGGNLSFGIPKSSGLMQDYDWLNPYTSKWSKDDPDEHTNYSCHTNYLQQYIDFTISAGWNFVLSDNFAITPIAEYNHNLINMDGLDGFCTYKQDDWVEKKFTGKVISYKQVLNAFSLGFILDSSFSIFELNNYFSISPHTTTIDAYDYHWIRSALFYDMINSPFKIFEKASFGVNLKDKYLLNLFGTFTYIPVSTGKDYTYSISKQGKIISKGMYAGDDILGGTRRLLWSFGLSMGIYF